MAANEGQITRLPGGLGQFTWFAKGAAAGDVTVTGVGASDKLLLVQAIILSGGLIASTADLTSEFSITAADTVNNTGGTSTAAGLVAVTVARTKA